jgi:hypothetical protein
MNVRAGNLKWHDLRRCAKQSCGVVSRNNTLFFRRGSLGWKNSGNRCAQSIGIHGQFAMSLPHALSHAPEPDAHPGSLGLNLCEAFRRHSLPAVLNLGINFVGLTSDTDYRSFAS